MRFAGAAVAVCLLLSGCGGADAGNADSPPTSTPSATAPSKAGTTAPVKPSVAAPTGTPRPQDLVDFQCYTNAAGVWNSSGILKNESARTRIYQVTVFVGTAGGAQAKAKTKQYVVTSEGSARIALAKLPAGQGADQCHVQVLAK